MKTRKEKFEEFIKEAGFNSIHDFANKTVSPYTGKSRSSAGIKRHLEQAPQDLRVLKGYAQDLNISLNEIFELFDIDIENENENDFNFCKFLVDSGFNYLGAVPAIEKGDSEMNFHLYQKDSLKIRFFKAWGDVEIAVINNGLLRVKIDFDVYSEKLAKKLIQ
jgi:hypothetical protein